MVLLIRECLLLTGAVMMLPLTTFSGSSIYVSARITGASVTAQTVPAGQKTVENSKKVTTTKTKKSLSTSKKDQDDAQASSDPGVMEVLSGLKGLQTSLVDLFSKVAAYVDQAAANGGKAKEEEEAKLSPQQRAEKTLRESTKRGNRPTKNSKKEDDDDDDAEEDYNDKNWRKQQKKRAFDAKKPSSGPKVRQFASNWLSLFGWSSGLTGLAKDFIFNYFKRDFFHDRNGPLINSVKSVMNHLAKRSDDQDLVEAVLTMVQRGQAIFTREGALQSLFEDLAEITGDSRFFDALVGNGAIGRKELSTLSETLRFLITDIKHQQRPISDEELNELDMDEL